MNKSHILITMFTILLPLGMLTGCAPPDNPNTNSNSDSHNHAHDHGDDHDEGPHQGHLIELGDEEYHAEWVHEDESGKITVYILAGDAKTDLAIIAQQITITTVVKEKDPKDYSLAAVNATTGDSPTAFCFEIVDKQLLIALKMSQGVQSSIAVEIKGKKYSGQIEHHDHSGHHHAH